MGLPDFPPEPQAPGCLTQIYYGLDDSFQAELLQDDMLAAAGHMSWMAPESTGH